MNTKFLYRCVLYILYLVISFIPLSEDKLEGDSLYYYLLLFIIIILKKISPGTLSKKNLFLHRIFPLHHVSYAGSVTCLACDGCDGDENETLTGARVYSWQAVAWITALDYLMWLF